MANNPYQTVANQILASLEAGVAPWVKPWAATPGQNMPQNISTGRPYSGCNVILLWQLAGIYGKPHFLTYRQAKALGGFVREGEKGFTVYFVKPMVSKKEGDETGKAFTMLKAYTVFNVAQCDNLPEKIVSPAPVKPRHDDERDATVDEFITASGAEFSETGGDRAFYAPSRDCVCVPVFTAFKSAADYYSTVFHELGHWTGAASRCAREFGKRFGDRQYAAEELVAELTSAFLCAEFSINGKLQHADYIANWIALLKDDAKAFFTAASAAQKAADWLRRAALASDLPIAA